MFDIFYHQLNKYDGIFYHKSKRVNSTYYGSTVVHTILL